MSEPEIITFGCRLNAAESETMRASAVAAGLGNAIIVNTCAVTGEAVRQAAQAIRRARRLSPTARIIVTGCAAQIEPERFAAMVEVDHVIGNAEKLQPASYAALAADALPRLRVADIMSVRRTAPHLLAGFGGRARAFVEVQNGCDHRCTFCVIPYGRGRSRSVGAGEVVGQVRRLVEAGCQEVVLTGVDLTAYGGDLPAGMTLGKLVGKILELVPELPRLRLSSIDSIEADEALVEAFASQARLMPHLHLSLQSGDDMILKRMKRRHDRADAIRFVERIRALRPDTVFGADIIAGFPTETEEMFENSLALVEECGLTYLHVFPFSPRTGTPAARMPQLPRRTIKERAARLRERGRARLAVYLDRQRGATVEALVEADGIGRTPHYAEIRLDGAEKKGLVRARVDGHDGTRLSGTSLA